MIKKTLQNLVDTKKIVAYGTKKDEKYCLGGILTNIANIDDLENLKAVVCDPDFVAIMKDKDLVASINAFFASNLNISETSKQSFLHRNTLVYRLDKIERTTGFNLRNFSDAVSFKLLMLVYGRLGAK